MPTRAAREQPRTTCHGRVCWQCPPTTQVRSQRRRIGCSTGRPLPVGWPDEAEPEGPPSAGRLRKVRMSRVLSCRCRRSAARSLACCRVTSARRHAQGSSTPGSSSDSCHQISDPWRQRRRRRTHPGCSKAVHLYHLHTPLPKPSDPPQTPTPSTPALTCVASGAQRAHVVQVAQPAALVHRLDVVGLPRRALRGLRQQPLEVRLVARLQQPGSQPFHDGAPARRRHMWIWPGVDAAAGRRCHHRQLVRQSVRDGMPLQVSSPGPATVVRWQCRHVPRPYMCCLQTHSRTYSSSQVPAPPPPPRPLS